MYGVVDLDPMAGSGFGRSAKVSGGGWWFARMVMVLMSVAQLIAHLLRTYHLANQLHFESIIYIYL